MWRADHTPKPVVNEVAKRRDRTRLPVNADRPWLDISRADFDGDRMVQLARLYGRYRQHATR
jgi:hypothetical protein